MIDDILFDVDMVYEIPPGQPGGYIRGYISGDGSDFDFTNGEKSVISVG